LAFGLSGGNFIGGWLFDLVVSVAAIDEVNGTVTIKAPDGTVEKVKARVFGKTVDRGCTVLSLRVLESEVAPATGILDLHRPIDVQDRAVTSGIATVATVDAAAEAIAERSRLRERGCARRCLRPTRRMGRGSVFQYLPLF
jgi:hypothetical protein